MVFEKNNKTSISEKIRAVSAVVGETSGYSNKEGYKITEDCFDRVYEILAEQGLVSREDTLKKQLLKVNINDLEQLENIEQIIDELTFSKLGNIYKLQYNGDLNFGLRMKYFNNDDISRINKIERTIDDNGNEKYTCFPRIKREVLPLIIPEIDRLPYEINEILEVDRKVIVVNCIDKHEDKAVAITKNYLIDDNKNLVEIVEQEEKRLIVANRQEYAIGNNKEIFERKGSAQLEDKLGIERIADGILNKNLDELRRTNSIKEWKERQ